MARSTKSAARARKKAIQNTTLEKLMLLIIGVDQTAKSCVDGMPAKDFPHPVPELDNRVIIYRNHNEGLPFGLFAENKDLAKYIPVAVTSLLGAEYIWLKSQNERKLMRLALAVAMAGSLSNICDRFFRGYVVDYLCVDVGELKKVVFNLGDLSVLAGFSLMTVLELAGGLGIRGE